MRYTTLGSTGISVSRRAIEAGINFFDTADMYALGMSEAVTGRALGTSDRKGWSRFVSMQNHYNLLYREEEREMIPRCASEKIAVLPWSPLARGLLAGARTALDDRTSTTRAIATERGVPMAQIALAGGVVSPTCREGSRVGGTSSQRCCASQVVHRVRPAGRRLIARAGEGYERRDRLG